VKTRYDGRGMAGETMEVQRVATKKVDWKHDTELAVGTLVRVRRCTRKTAED